MNIKEIKETKNDLQKAANKGFGYFMKNVGMVLLLMLSIYIITNPTIITRPSEFFDNFDINSLWVVLVLFFALGGFYQLAKDVDENNKKERDKENIEKYIGVLDRRKEATTLKHNELVKERFKVGPLISNELKNLLIKLDADRAAIVEMHNGTNNMSGLPFVFGDMVYEEISPNVEYASDEFKNFNLAKLPFVALHYDENTWIGSVDDIESEDPYFAAKLRAVGVNYGAFVVLEGVNGPLGFLTLFFKDEKKHPSKAKIIAELNHSSQILSTLLNKYKE